MSERRHSEGICRPGPETPGKKQKYARQHTQQYRSLLEAAKGLGIKYAKSQTKKKLAVLVKRGMEKPAGTGARKRSYVELVSAVHARGGSEYERMKSREGGSPDVYPKSSWKRCWLNPKGGVHLYSCMLSDTGVKKNSMKEEHPSVMTYT